MYTVIGKERKVGNYEGREYDNTYLHCTYDKDKCEGLAVVSFKVKTDNLLNVDCEVDLGTVITPYFDRFGNVVDVRIANVQ